MTPEQVIEVLRAAFAVFLKTELSAEVWEQYGLALEGVNPGDMDDALSDLRKSHAFHNAPLPAEILSLVNAHRARRIADMLPVILTIKADPSEGEWKTFELGGKTLRMHVLPDDHPALMRYACLRCKDTGWEELSELNPGKQPTYQRCGCVARNPVVQQTRTRNAEHARQKVAK